MGQSERAATQIPTFKRDPSLLVQIALNSYVYQSNPLGLAGVDWFWGSSCAGCQSLWRDDLGLGLAEETRLVHRLSDSRWSHQQLCGIASGTKDSQKQTLHMSQNPKFDGDKNALESVRGTWKLWNLQGT